jgi:acetyl-CoA C-acetyltransferase
MTKGVAAIAGIYEHPLRKMEGLTPLQIKAECAARALEDAGLSWRDVDGLFDAGDGGGMAGFEVAQYFGIEPNVIDTTMVGGSSFELHTGHAMRAIAAGRCNVALLTYGSTARSESHAIGTGAAGDHGRPSAVSNMEDPYGLTLVGNYALVATRHMEQYGTTPAQLAEVAVTTRFHAMRNPDARRGLVDIGQRNVREITIDDVLESGLVADPLRLYDCCVVSDGGGAVVIVSAEVARGVRKKPVWILGAAEATRYTESDTDITISAGARSAPAALSEAGVRPEDIDIAMLYDSFTITVLTILEDIGFCKKGEGGPYVEGGRLRYDQPGGPALNPDGGGLSSNHPGMRGIFLLIEATRQLRGESTAQVNGAQLAIAHGNGGMLATRHVAGTVVLGTL